MKQLVNLFLILLLPVIFKGNVKMQSQEVLFAPNLIAPAHKSASFLPPAQFIWNEVEGAAVYSIQITTDVTFLNVNSSANDVDVEDYKDTMYLPAQDLLLTDTMYFWRVKAKSLAGTESDWSLIQMFITGVNSIYEVGNDNGITISPMPIRHTAIIDFNSSTINSLTGISQLQVFVFNSGGVMIDSILLANVINGNKIEFHTDNYTSGCYYLIFSDGKKVLGSEAIIIEK